MKFGDLLDAQIGSRAGCDHLDDLGCVFAHYVRTEHVSTVALDDQFAEALWVSVDGRAYEVVVAGDGDFAVVAVRVDQDLGLLGVLLEPTTVQCCARRDRLPHRHRAACGSRERRLVARQTRRVRPDDIEQALQRTPDDIKVVVELAHA